jgi:three-Cys-motif partner protein
MSKRTRAKDIVLPHSQAKLDLYKNYLVNYLKVLTLTPYCSKINLFDIYCGIGLYEDGNIGSPIITNNSIKEVNQAIRLIGKPVKPIAVFINDYETEKIKNVESLITKDEIQNCSYEFFNEDADHMLDIAASKVNSFGMKERSLVFIDPYGYSHIQREKLYNLLRNEHTEILMFLPVMQMYRFTDIAINDPSRACYEDLRRFIFSFFPPSHKIHNDSIDNIFDFIHEIKIALTFDNKFYTCSHYIERDKGNYYALFFITSNMYGLDKMVEAKWKLDPIKGKGFTQKRSSPQTSMFNDHFEEQDNKRYLDFLKDLILKELKSRGRLSNCELYKLSLLNEFKPMHAKTLLVELVAAKKILPYDAKGNLLSQIDGAYMDYEHFKRKSELIFYKLNNNGTI